MNGNRYYSTVLLILIGLLTCAPVMAQGEKLQKENAQSKPEASAREQDENIPPDRISIHELKRMMDAKEEVVIVDNRAGSAYIGSTVKIKGAIHITLDDLEQKMKDLPQNKLIVTYCT